MENNQEVETTGKPLPLIDPEDIPAFEDAPKILMGSAPLALPKKPSTKVEQVPTIAAMPFLRTGKPANSFRQLKKAIIAKAGFDFLSVCADVMRTKNFNSGKIGVAYRSRHKCGDAFDVNQNTNKIVVVSEPHGTQQFFRLWLKCEKQDGSLGVKVPLKDIRGYRTNVYVLDFTSEAERLGWQRIPAWKGWSLKGSGYNKMEFWHYQNTEGLSWDEAMDFLYNDLSKILPDSRKPAPERIIGLNDRGSAVRNIQEKLSKIFDRDKQPYLPRHEIDGVFGKITQTAVKRLQEDYGLVDDGLVGPSTRELLERLTTK
jgi:hypothetical protein